MKMILYPVVIMALALSACSKEENPSAPDTELPRLEITTLREAPVTFGAAVNIRALRDDAVYSRVLREEFASVTAENVMKPEAMSTAPDTYDFTDADELVDFARANGMRVHGHTLIWHRSLPLWMQRFSGDKEAWKEMMRRYITGVVSHFRGRVASWDVVNEIFTDEGTLRENLWLQHIGEEYIALAFTYAHEADPDALLFYNEYGQEYSTAKVKVLTAKLRELCEAGVPVHGLGFQFHINPRTNEQFIRYGMRCAAELGLQVHIAELDVALNGEEKDPAFQYDAVQAEALCAKYRAVVQAYAETVPAAQRYGITLWGVTDNYSWLNEENGVDFPLLFDAQGQRKQAYTGVLEGLYSYER